MGCPALSGPPAGLVGQPAATGWGAAHVTFAVVLCLRVQQPHPQLLATNRHVSCGGVDVEDMTFAGDSLSGVSRAVAGDDYELFLTEPK